MFAGQVRILYLVSQLLWPIVYFVCFITRQDKSGQQSMPRLGGARFYGQSAAGQPACRAGRGDVMAVQGFHGQPLYRIVIGDLPSHWSIDTVSALVVVPPSVKLVK